ncbi:MAG: PRTRC system protein B [Sulfuricaulis sp.]
MQARETVTPLLSTPDADFAQRAARAKLETSLAVLFHTNGNALQLVTAHRVVNHRDRSPIISAGRPLMPADEREILDLLTSRDPAQGFSQVFPERLLFTDATRTLWWIPSAVRPMHLRGAKGAKTISTRWPALVALVRDRTLYLSAPADESRPNADTALFRAPLPNVFANTALCTGDARLPLSSTPAEIPGWESVIFDSAFTHSNFQQSLAAAAGKPGFAGVEGFWEKRDRKIAPFPVKRLVPLGQTLAQWFADPAGGSL